MDIENLLREKVYHKKYGSGIISSARDSHIEAQFPQYGKVCRFIYPWCFEKFLRLENEKKQEAVLAYLEQWKTENGINKKEAMRRQYEETQRKIAVRRKAVEERKLRSAQRVFERRYDKEQQKQ